MNVTDTIVKGAMRPRSARGRELSGRGDRDDVCARLDASAVLALLLAEPGGEAVAKHLGDGCISAVNWSFEWG